MPANHAAPPELDKNCTGVETIGLSGLLGVTQKAGVDAGIAKTQGLSVDADGAVLQRSDEVLRNVHQSKQVAAVREGGAVDCCDKGL